MAPLTPRRSERPGKARGAPLENVQLSWNTPLPPATARLAAGESGWAFLEEGGEAFLVIVAGERDAL